MNYLQAYYVALLVVNIINAVHMFYRSVQFMDYGLSGTCLFIGIASSATAVFCGYQAFGGAQ